MIKEQIEWLIEHKYMKRDEDNINMFIYMAWKDLKKRENPSKHLQNIEAWAWIQAGQIFCAVLPCLKNQFRYRPAAKKKFDKVWANIYQTLAAPSAQCDILC